MLMRNIKIYILLLAVTLLCSCEERHPSPFEDISGVYFNNLSSMMMVTDSLDLTFVYESGDSVEVPVRVQLMGRASDQPRPLDITVNSDDAVLGVDYLLPEEAVMPADSSYVDYIITLIRTQALKYSKKTIDLEIHANDHFTLPISHVVQVADTVSTLDFTISFSDMFTKAPAAWEANLVGEFTQQKFELACDVLNLDPADFNDPSVMTLAKMLYISTEMSAYVEAEVQKKEEGLEYDHNAFDPNTGEPLSFRKS